MGFCTNSERIFTIMMNNSVRFVVQDFGFEWVVEEFSLLMSMIWQHDERQLWKIFCLNECMALNANDKIFICLQFRLKNVIWNLCEV